MKRKIYRRRAIAFAAASLLLVALIVASMFVWVGFAIRRDPAGVAGDAVRRAGVRMRTT